MSATRRRPAGSTGTHWARSVARWSILMGMSERATIAAGLMAGGRDGDTPVAVVHWGTTAHQRVVRATLAELPSIELPAPATIVVGPVAALDLGPLLEGPTGR